MKYNINCIAIIFSLFLSAALWSCSDELEENLPEAAGEIEMYTDADGAPGLKVSPIRYANTYTWYLDGTQIASTTEPNFLVTKSGVYTVAGTNGFGQGEQSPGFAVDASGRPSQLSVTSTTSAEGIVTLTATADKATGYRWYLNGELLQRGSNSEYLPQDSGTYTVNAYNASGTSEEVTIEVKMGIINLLDKRVVPDAAFRKMISEKLAKGGDFYSNTEAATVTELEFKGTGVSDLTGLRFFSNLKELNMTYCGNVKRLDLHQLRELEYIDLMESSSLIELDITGLTKLYHININDSKIGTISIEDCRKSLKYFNAGWEKFVNIDFSDCENLEYVNLGGNTLLTSVNLKGLKKLQTVILNSTKITTLDLSGCTSLNSLTASYCTELTNLIIEPSAPLVELKLARGHEGVMNNVDLMNYKSTLQTLYADKIGISGTLDFSNFLQLENVQLDANSFSSIKFDNCKALRVLRIAENRNLKSVSLSGCIHLSTIYCYQTGVQSLDFSGCTGLTQAIIFENSNMATVNFDGCIMLAWLSMEYCKVGPNLDISATTELESVSCYSTNITKIKIASSYNCNNVPFSSKIPSGAVYVHEF